jgi:hypothetical protein
LVIDYFLDHNQDLEVVGKFCIAWAILEAEAVYRQKHRGGMEINYENHWYRFLIHKLTTGCPDIPTFLQNRVSFITFNYDVSLEYELCRGLSALKRFSQKNTIQTFLGGNRITHVYGRIRRDPFLAPPQLDLQALAGPVGAQKPDLQWQQSVDLMDRIYEASSGLNIISPGKAAAVTNDILAARRNISEARCVYILGYGFDRANSELLELPEHLRLAGSQKKVMFTDYKDGGVVNKNAARLFGISPNELLQPGGHIVPSGAGWCEKSIKNVYDALAVDFDSRRRVFLEPAHLAGTVATELPSRTPDAVDGSGTGRACVSCHCGVCQGAAISASQICLRVVQSREPRYLRLWEGPLLYRGRCQGPPLLPHAVALFRFS